MTAYKTFLWDPPLHLFWGPRNKVKLCVFAAFGESNHSLSIICRSILLDSNYISPTLSLPASENVPKLRTCCSEISDCRYPVKF